MRQFSERQCVIISHHVGQKKGEEKQRRTRDVLEMTTVLQPRSTSRDMISRALPLHLNQNRQIRRRLSVPWRKRRKELQTVALGVNGDLDGGTVGGRRLEGVLSGVVAPGGKLEAGWVGELEFLAVGALEGVGERVEGQVAGEGKGGDDVRGSDEGVRGGVSVVTASEVTVVRSDDCRRRTQPELAMQSQRMTRKSDALELASPFFTSLLSH